MTGYGWVVPTDVARTRSQYEQIARGADQAGYDLILLPWTAGGDDPVVLAGILARVTRRIRIVVELHTAAGSPVYLAKLFASLQRASGGRIDLALRDRADGDFAHASGDDVEDAAARTAEFITVFTGVWNETGVSENGSPFDYDGEHFHVAGGGLTGVLSGIRRPALLRAIGSDADPGLFDAVLARPQDARPGDIVIAGISAGEPFIDTDVAVPAVRALADAGAAAVVFAADDPFDLFRVAEAVLPELETTLEGGIR